jgi:hypothetical protein
MAKLNLQDLAKNEAVKELFRVIAIAVIPVVIDSLQQGKVDYRTLLVVAVIAGLKSIDKYLHKIDSDNLVTNLLKFE